MVAEFDDFIFLLYLFEGRLHGSTKSIIMASRGHCYPFEENWTNYKHDI
jgi:hypothetical protein